MADLYEEKNLAAYYYLIIESKLIKAVPTLMMILSLVVVGPPLLIAGFGLNNMLLLRYISSKRYEKMDLFGWFRWLRWWFRALVVSWFRCFIVSRRVMVSRLWFRGRATLSI
ncbi:MAG: hypothetical protein ACMUIP_00495 [bacterium]